MGNLTPQKGLLRWLLLEIANMRISTNLTLIITTLLLGGCGKESDARMGLFSA
jgi:hypothetical protein